MSAAPTSAEYLELIGPDGKTVEGRVYADRIVFINPAHRDLLRGLDGANETGEGVEFNIESATDASKALKAAREAIDAEADPPDHDVVNCDDCLISVTDPGVGAEERELARRDLKFALRSLPADHPRRAKIEQALNG